MKKSQIIALGVSLIAVSAYGVEFGKHPHLQHAHQALENATKALEQANDKKKTEFGGHRAKAIELIKGAQHEIEEAAAYANDPANK